MADDPAPLQAGRRAFEAGDFRGARTQLAQAVLHRPADREARFWLAATEYHLGQTAEARRRLEPLVEGPAPVPGRPAAVHEYLCRCRLGDDPEAAAAVGEAGVRVDPADPRLRFAVGTAHARAGRHQEALRHFDEGWRLEGGRDGTPAFPRHPGQLAFARSTALMALGRWPEALAAVDDALAREPANPVLHNRRGVVLFEGGQDPAAAVAAVRRAIELDPDTLATGRDGSYHYNLAVFLERLGRVAEARAAVERALAIAPAVEYRALRDRLAGGAGTAGLTFADVGGMHALKAEARRIMELILVRRDQARRYGIVRNGLLLYGPPGCGKTFFAEALAGEYRLAFMPVTLGAALTRWVGGAAEALERVFRQARDRAPVLLFLDELDALAPRRDDVGAGHEQQAVAALLQQLDAARGVPGLVLAAATNRLEAVDPAVIREGRFDFKVRIYRPDFDARREILVTLLDRRPHDRSVDLGRLAQRTEGFSAAQLRHLVDSAALAALEADAPITGAHLDRAFQERLADGRRPGPPLTWDDLVLPAAVRRRLQSIERFIEHPELARELGVTLPTGALLHGPPGTGKTTVARVLAAQTEAAFLTVTPADIFSKWLGESEQRVKELFERARDQVPAIVFIDEIDAILGRRGATDSGAGRAANAVVSTFLTELDGIAPLERVFVLGATNRRDLVDEAVLRPGRLSEEIEIGLPDRAARRALLDLFTARMRLAPEVDLAALATRTEGASGAALRGLCTAAGRHALLRILEAGPARPGPGEGPAGRTVVMADFERALEELAPGDRPAFGFVPDRR